MRTTDKAYMHAYNPTLRSSNSSIEIRDTGPFARRGIIHVVSKVHL